MADMYRDTHDRYLHDAELRGAVQWLARVVHCSEQTPPVELRVLFFVPSHGSPERRWRVGHYQAPPLYTETQWRDEETEVGDDLIEWRIEQVTHWMRMPEHPSVCAPARVAGYLKDGTPVFYGGEP